MEKAAQTFEKSHPLLPQGGGITGDLFRSIEWKNHPLGDASAWPVALRIALPMLFKSRHPMFIFWGPELYQFYNDSYLPSIAIGKHPVAMGQKGRDCWPEIWTVIGPQIEAVMNEGAATWSENQLIPIFRNGGIEDVYWTYGYSPIYNEDGTVGGVLVVCTETTQSVISLKAIEAAQLDLIDNLESMSDAFFSVDSNWIMTQINERMLKISGKARQELIGHNFIETFLNRPEHRETQYWHQYHKAMEERVAVSFDDYYQPLAIWTRVRAFPKRDGGLAIFYSDITEQKNAEQLIAESEASFRAIAEVSPQIVWTARADGAVDYANSQWYAYSGLTPEETMGSGFASIIHPEDVENTLKQWSEAIATGKPMYVEHRFRRGTDGIYRWFMIRAQPKMELGVVVKWFGTITDIHEQRLIAEELAQARDEANRANQAKSAFLANMSHEIRTPLGAILGFSDLLRDRDLSEDERNQFLDTVCRNGKALTRLIDDILDLAKVESGKLDTEILEFSLFAMIDDVVELFRERSRGKQIYLRSHFEPGCPDRIKSDPTRLRQILVNIIGNAIKFTEVGGVTIEVSAPSVDSARATFLIKVKDTGPGLSEDQVENLFQPFMQADNSTTRKFGGTGLGLVLSKRLANALGGDVRIAQSKKGVGCNFVISFSADLPALANTQTEGNRSAGKTTPTRSGLLAKIRVLIADDIIDNQRLISRFLTKEEAEVVTVGTGVDALRSALTEDFDLVLMDIQMPQMDGYEAIRRLREAGYKKPIVALTAHAMAEEKARILAAGFSDHLAKPIDRLLLIKAVHKHVFSGESIGMK